MDTRKYELSEEEDNVTEKTEEPQTAKDLFSVFAPDSESESDVDADDDKEFVPSKKKKLSSTPTSGKKVGDHKLKYQNDC